MKLVDVLDSKSCEGNLVPVRLRPAAPTKKDRLTPILFRLACQYGGVELGASNFVACSPSGEKTVQWTVLREAREKRLRPAGGGESKRAGSDFLAEDGNPFVALRHFP